MCDITYRGAQPGDAADMAELELLCFSDPWKQEAIRKDIEDNPLARYTVAESEGRIIAFGGLWIVVDQGHIIDIAVHPAYRRKGIGRRIVALMIERSEREGALAHTLEVRESNEPALAMYASFGFHIVGKREHYYQNPDEDALILWRASPCNSQSDRGR